MGGCCILHCKKRSERKEDFISFHLFPSDPYFKQKWIAATGRANWLPKKCSKICSIHFDDNHFVGMKKTSWLKPNAVPTKNVHNTNLNTEVISQITPVKTIAHGGEYIEYNMMKTEIKEVPVSFHCTEEVEYTVKCEEPVNCEESEDKKVIKLEVLEDMTDIESQGLMDEGDIKYEVLEEAIDIVKHELTYEEDVRHEESEGADCLKVLDFEDAVPVKKCKLTQGYKEDRSILTPAGKNILERHRTVTEESSNKSINTHMSNVLISKDSDDKDIRRTHINHDAVNTKNNLERPHQNGTVSVNKRTETHIQKTRHECEICKRTYSRARYLKKHMTLHTEDKPFQCNICQQKFRSVDFLNIHIRKHTGDTPFECEICQRKFTCSNYLKKHLVTHANEKPFECEICQRKFTCLMYLKKHSVTHANERPFGCDICQRKFSRTDGLNTHMRTHTGEKPFKCDICGYSCVNKSSYINHLPKHNDEA